MLNEDNRAYVWESPNDASLDNVYDNDKLLGGGLKFSVDVQHMGAKCAGGIALVNLDDQTCDESDVENGYCNPTKIFSANQFGYKFDFGGLCKFNSANLPYGPDLALNSRLPYEVEIKFV